MDPLDTRLGYTVSGGIYLPWTAANGLRVKVTAGYAEFYAGAPSAISHRALNALSVGEIFEVTGLAVGEVLSVQSAYDFSYELLPPEEEEEEDEEEPPSDPDTPAGSSQNVTWNCTGSNCPWGSTLTGIALVWPEELGALDSRMGYTVSKPIYLPASVANTVTLTITGGYASLYAGPPNDSSHRGLITLSVGESYDVSGLAAGEVLSVQSSTGFQYEIELSGPPEDPPAEEEDPPPGGAGDDESHVVTWSCTGEPCPWGSSLTGPALVWPDDSPAITDRLGYTTSHPIYLPSTVANGTSVKIKSGSATLYAGFPEATSHRALMSLAAGDGPFVVSGLVSGEVLSVQSGAPFTFEVTLGDPSSGGDDDPGDEPGSEPDEDGVYHSQLGYWRCNVPECTSADWVAHVLTWPEWAAYSSNARTGDNSRTVFSSAGHELHTYMGPWANGCQVTVESGTVLIVEWERGTDEWRETEVEAGQTHTIQLVGSEDSAMIETRDFAPAFSVRLQNCTPQPVP